VYSYLLGMLHVHIDPRRIVARSLRSSITLANPNVGVFDWSWCAYHFRTRTTRTSHSTCEANPYHLGSAPLAPLPTCSRRSTAELTINHT